jgi:hypothetical protein
LMLSLDATLNPTRYVAHQSARAWAAQPLSAWNLGEPNLYRRPSPRRAPGEVVLDQEDNVLLGPAAERFGRRHCIFIGTGAHLPRRSMARSGCRQT